MIVIKQIKRILASIVVAYAPSLFIIAALIGGDGAFFDTPFIFDLLIVLLYTFPIIVGTIGFLLCLVRVIDDEKHISVYNLITMLISLSAIAITFVLSEHIYVSIALAVLLLVVEIAHCVKVKSIINVVQFFKQTSFWVIVFCILLSVTLCSSVYRFTLNDGAHADPLDYARENSDDMGELESQISNKYELENYKLIRITIASVDNGSPKYQMIVTGSYTKNAKVELWTQSYEITYDDFKTFYELHNNEVVYSAEKNKNYDLVTNVNSETIIKIAHIVFE